MSVEAMQRVREGMVHRSYTDGRFASLCVATGDRGGETGAEVLQTILGKSEVAQVSPAYQLSATTTELSESRHLYLVSRQVKRDMKVGLKPITP